MNIKTKRIIAREFLVLVVVLVLGIIAFSCTYGWNHYYKGKMNDIDTLISLKHDTAVSLRKPYESKLARREAYLDIVIRIPSDKDDFTSVFDAAVKARNLHQPTWDNLVSMVNNNTIESDWNEMTNEYYKRAKKADINSAKQLRAFVVANMLSQSDVDNYNHANDYDSEINNLNYQKEKLNDKRLYFNEQIHWALHYTLIFALILFGLRYIFYGIKWSIKTLKQKPQ